MPTDPAAPGASLIEYPRPSIAVDVAVLTIRNGRLQVVVVDHRFGGLALPGTFLHRGERLVAAASRALADKAGLSAVQFAQLKVLDDPDRDERGWVLSVAHSGAVPDRELPPGVQLMPVMAGRSAAELMFDHGAMVELAVEQLRRRYATTLDPGGLLDETFTVLQLRQLYQAVYDRELLKDTFRRYVIGAIEATGETDVSLGRPAELFRRRPQGLLPPAFWTWLGSESLLGTRDTALRP